MCSIVRIKGKFNSIRVHRDSLFGRDNIMQDILSAKGGEQFGAKIIFLGKPEIISIEDKVYNIFLKKLYEFFEECDNDRQTTLIIHSRQAPEMESRTILNQPYTCNDHYNDVIAVHGTIPNVHEVELELGIKIPVDTDIFNFLPFNDAVRVTESLGGKISAISIYEVYTNGLGLYSFEFDELEIVTNISSKYYNMDKYDFKNMKQVKGKILPEFDRPERIIILSTGGLDITTSSMKVFEETVELYSASNQPTSPHKVEHWYFDWGSNAAEKEIETVNQLINMHYKNNKFYDNILEFEQLETFGLKGLFQSVLSMTGNTKTRISDPDAIGGGHNEAEEAISYVPYRNTYLMTTAAVIAEHRYPNEKVQFVIGANLSEGMIYLDNSTEWLAAMTRTIKVGGQKCFNFRISAPFATDTKTNMLKKSKDNIKQFQRATGFDIDKHTFSCYFPDEDGKKCGKCGSCILKANAIEKSGINKDV